MIVQGCKSFRLCSVTLILSTVPRQIKIIGVFLLSLAFLVSPHCALAQNARITPNQAAILECLHKDIEPPLEDPCFGMIAERCDARPLNATVGSPACWAEEYFAWHGLMTSTYRLLESEVSVDFLAAIQKSQSNWETQAKLDCALVVASNPQTYDARPPCRAKAAMKRYLFLGELLGADWSASP